MTIIRGTTPVISFVFSEVNAADITVAILTIKQSGETIIEKDLDTATRDETGISWQLSQAETLSLSYVPAVVACDWKLATGVRGRSNVVTATVEASGKNEVI